MERLTRKISKSVQDEFSLGSYSVYDFNNSDTNKLLNKLGKVEDLMEYYNVEDLEHLDIILFILSGETKHRLKEIQQENKAHKDMWNKLREYVTAEFEKDNKLGYIDFACVEEDVLDKMRKLEKENEWIEKK